MKRKMTEKAFPVIIPTGGARNEGLDLSMSVWRSAYVSLRGRTGSQERKQSIREETRSRLRMMSEQPDRQPAQSLPASHTHTQNHSRPNDSSLVVPPPSLLRPRGLCRRFVSSRSTSKPAQQRFARYKGAYTPILSPFRSIHAEKQERKNPQARITTAVSPVLKLTTRSKGNSNSSTFPADPVSTLSPVRPFHPRDPLLKDSTFRPW